MTKGIVASSGSPRTRLHKARPSINGIFRSEMIASGRMFRNKSSASNPSAASNTRYPASSSAIAATVRNISSSSTSSILFCITTSSCCGQFNEKMGAARFSVDQSYLPAVRLDDSPGDSQPQARTSLFALADEWLEDPFANLRRHAGSIVDDVDPHQSFFTLRTDPDRAAVRHGL